MEDSRYEELALAIDNGTLSFDDGLKLIDEAFNGGWITQREWAKLHESLPDT